MNEKSYAIIGLTILGAMAIYKGIDSGILVAVAGAIGALGGYTVGKRSESTNSR